MNAIARKRFKGIPDLPPLGSPSFPADYALTVSGSCLEPHIPEGSIVHISSILPPVQGRLVVIYPRGEKDFGYGVGNPIIKVMVHQLPPWVKEFPFDDNPKSEIWAALTLGLYQPGGTFSVLCREIAALHHVVGFIRPRKRP